MYASPKRLLMNMGEDFDEDYPSFIEDAFSLGVVFLLMLTCGHPEPFAKVRDFFKNKVKVRLSKDLFVKALTPLLDEVHHQVVAGPKLEGFFLLIKNLLNWESTERVDLMAACKYIRLLCKGYFRTDTKYTEFLTKEVALS